MRIIFYSLPEKLNEGFLRKAVAATLKKEKKPKAALGIIFLSKDQIGKLNFNYRREKEPTDILSFSSGGESFSQEDKNYLGELAICLSCVEENARRFKEPLERELARILIHGTLHLLGYNHGRSKIMITKQEAYLSSIH